MWSNLYLPTAGLILVIILFLSAFKFRLRWIEIKRVVKGDTFQRDTIIHIVFFLLFIIIMLGILLAAWNHRGPFSAVERDSILNGLIYPIIVALIGLICIAIYKNWYRVAVEKKKLLPEREEGERREITRKVPKITLSFRWVKPEIIIAAYPGEFILPNIVNLFLPLEKVGNITLMRAPQDLRHRRYKIAVVIATDQFLTRGVLYSTEGKRTEFHNELVGFLDRGNYLIATHDCHFWDKVGTFGGPITEFEVIPKCANHPICKGVSTFTIQSEGSQVPDNNKESIAINKTPDTKGFLELLSAKVKIPETSPSKEETSNRLKGSIILSEFPAAWLLKYRNKDYNIFYSYMGHDKHIYYTPDLLLLITNAAAYFSKAARRFL